MRTWLSLAALLLLTLWDAAPAAAQEPPATALPPPVTLAYAEGRVDLVRSTGPEAAQAPDLLEDGDWLATGDGRAELVVADGSIVHVDRDTDLQVERDVRLRVVRGRLIVRTSPSATLEITTAVGLVQLAPRGEYEISTRDLDGPSTIATRAGQATLVQGPADLPIGPDDELWIDPRGGEPRWARVGPRRDAFIDWSDRRAGEMRTAQAAQPLPAELGPYAQDFATYGTWDTLPTYGAVWYPSVAAGWRPYAYGSWRHTRYGWTWIDVHRWGWPVHHYGRWGRHPNRGWYWMPRPGWGPAWVGWATQANFVGWAPLGWNSRPVVDFYAGGQIGAVGVRAGWSVIPRPMFGVRGPVGPHFTDVHQLPGPVAGGFLTGPVAGGFLPGPVAGGFPQQDRVPRGSTWRRPEYGNRYGRPTPYHPRGYDRAPGATRVPVPGGQAVPRARSAAPSSTVPVVRDGAVRTRDGVTPDVRASRAPDARRPGDAPARRDDVGQANRREPGAAGSGTTERNAYGRPSAAPEWGRPATSTSAGRAGGADRRGDAGRAQGSGPSRVERSAAPRATGSGGARAAGGTTGRTSSGGSGGRSGGSASSARGRSGSGR